jgi:hypothetical protein
LREEAATMFAHHRGKPWPRRCLAPLAVWLLAIAAAHPSLAQDAPEPPAPPSWTAEAWPAADKLFRGDDHWVGGDGAYSIDLGDGRVLWMFGDSLIDPTGAGSRKSPGMTMVSNSVAIQRGYDPSDATMEFAWRTAGEGKPTAFFPDGDDYRYWPGHGLRIRDRLIVFLMKVRRTTGGLGFDVGDWEAVLIRNPDAEPAAWELTWLEAPNNDRKVIVGSASVLVEGDFVYACSTQERRNHPVFLVRWPVEDVYEGRLATAEWWCGSRGWLADGAAEFDPAPVLDDAATEFTVHRDNMTGNFLQFQTVGFGPATVNQRAASSLTGPWSRLAEFYKPPEFGKPKAWIYQGKAHPHLVGADLVATYSTNAFELGDMLADDSLYFPRFVRLSRK